MFFFCAYMDCANINITWDISLPLRFERFWPKNYLAFNTRYCFWVQANATKKFSFPYRWIVIGKAVNESNAVTSDFNDLPLLPDSDVVIAQKNDSDSYILSMSKLTFSNIYISSFLPNVLIPILFFFFSRAVVYMPCHSPSPNIHWLSPNINILTDVYIGSFLLF